MITCLFVHGGPGMDASYFRPYFDKLKGHFNLFYYRQKRKPKNGMADLVSELQEQVYKQTPPVFLIAHSWGTTLALEYMAKVTSPKVAALVLIGTIADPSFEKASHEARSSMASWVDPSVRARFQEATVRDVPLFFSRSHWEEGAKLWEGIDLCQETLTLLHETYLKSFDLRSVLRSIDVPVLNLFGEADLRVPATYSRQVSALNPRMENAAIPGAGHFPFVERTDLVMSSIISFAMRVEKALGYPR